MLLNVGYYDLLSAGNVLSYQRSISIRIDLYDKYSAYGITYNRKVGCLFNEQDLTGRTANRVDELRILLRELPDGQLIDCLKFQLFLRTGSLRMERSGNKEASCE